MADKKKGSVSEPPKGSEAATSGKNHALEKDNEGRNKKSHKILKAFTIIFSILNVLTAIVAVTLIAVSTLSAIIASSLDTQDASGRLVALIVLVVTAAVAIAVVVYAQLAVCRGKIRPIFVASIVLCVLACIQTIVAGASVRVTEGDQAHIAQGLTESFQLSKQHNPRHVKMWASTQHSLKCCGLYTPYDYRAPNSPAYMPPDVPVSCCPNYDPDRSDLVQEKEREFCKARNEYFNVGCSGPVLEVITDSSLWAFSVAINLVILEAIAAIFGAAIVQARNKMKARKGDLELKADPESIATKK